MINIFFLTGNVLVIHYVIYKNENYIFNNINKLALDEVYAAFDLKH